MGRDDLSSAQKELGKDVRALREDFDSLRDDMQELVRALASSGRGSVTGTGQRLQKEAQQRIEHLGERYSRLRSAGRDRMSRAQSRIEQHPVLSLSIAFGAGLAVGQLMQMRR